QRPGAEDRAVQGPVRERRRAGRASDRVHVRSSVFVPRALRRACSTVVVTSLAAASLVACSSLEEPDRTVTVSGAFGGVPQLEYTKPLVVTEPYVEVVWEGEGAKAVE